MIHFLRSALFFAFSSAAILMPVTIIPITMMPFAVPPFAAADANAGEKNSKTAAPKTYSGPPPLPVRKPPLNELIKSTQTKKDIPQKPEPAKVLTQWSKEKIERAQKQCSLLLAKFRIQFEPAAPIRKNRCGAPAPLKVMQVGDAPAVTIFPAATLNCPMAAALEKWLRLSVQPAAKKYLGSPIVSIRNVASYACRTRYGDPRRRMSEHAFVNALDIASFKTENGQRVSLLKHWGPNQRMIAAQRLKRERIRAAREARAKGSRTATAPQNSTAAPPQNSAATTTKKAAAHSAQDEADLLIKAALAADALRKAQKQAQRKTTGPKSDKKTSAKNGLTRLARDNRAQRANQAQRTNQAESSHQKTKSAALKTPALNTPALKTDAVKTEPGLPPALVPSQKAEALFLREIHKGACGIFGTVLGPEANNAHNNHFHLDLAPRKRSAYCE